MTPSSFAKRTVAVTGGAGLIGSYVCDELVKAGARVIVIDDFSRGLRENIAHHSGRIEFREGDLENASFAESALADADILCHLASRAYGIGYGEGRHLEIFQHNERITNNLLAAIARHQPKQTLIVSSSCVYDDDGPNPMAEAPLFRGEPERANRGYGWAKRFLEQKCQNYAGETGVRMVIARPFNVYGERYNWAGAHSQAIPMLVKKVMDGDDPVTIWGSGDQRRNYMHASDCARAMLGLIEAGDIAGPINVASEETVSMRELVETICRVAGRRANIAVDLSKPEGRFIKSADAGKLRAALPDFRASVGLQDGLKRMIGWHAARFLAADRASNQPA